MKLTLTHSMLALLLTAFATEALAQSDDPNAGPPRLVWIQPTAGARIIGRQFTLKMRAEGDPAGPLSTLDHFHYNVAPLGEASATPGKFTTANTTGIQDVNIDTLLGFAAEPGTYEACNYMATAVHARITQPNCISFRLVFSGVNIDSPRDGETLRDERGNQAVVSTFGEPGITAVRFQIDTGAVQTDTTGQGILNLPALPEGVHSLTAWGEDASNKLVGDKTTVQFAIRPRLSYSAIQDVYSAIQQSLTLSSDERKAALESALDSLTLMTQGGAKDKNPVHLKISTKNAKKLLSAYRAALSHTASKRYSRYAKKVSKLAATMLAS